VVLQLTAKSLQEHLFECRAQSRPNPERFFGLGAVLCAAPNLREGAIVSSAKFEQVFAKTCLSTGMHSVQ
jgi:hypothetical protein